MANINSIINTIDTFLESKNQLTTTPVEISPVLEKKGLLNDSTTRPGKRLRKLLRNKEIPHAYQIGVKWYIPHSNGKKPKAPIIKAKPTNSKNIKPSSTVLAKEHKLINIAETILEIIEVKYNKQPQCYYEYKPEWLLTFPDLELIKKYPELGKVYTVLTEKTSSLQQRILKLSSKQLMQRQSFDIWIGKPFNFAIEFDEKQHFNQYRKSTLKFYNNIPTRFPVDFYKQLNNNTFTKPGTSGFTKLKSIDPLFPEMYIGPQQDNRTRQRAFRDYLKDLLPIHFGYKPTLRIPYHITNKKINRFSDIEIKKIREYIDEYKLL